MADELRDNYTMDRLRTPIGVALVVFDDQEKLCGLDWEEFEARLSQLFRARLGRTPLFAVGRAPDAIRAPLERYFDGDVHAVDGIECGAQGTRFQRAVWTALRTIPAGTTMTYGGLATAIAAPKASRAVGLANNRNPIGVVVPCHRVIGADGTLTGYAGGLDRKRWLLDHEARNARQPEWIASTALASSTSSGDSFSRRAINAR